MILDCFSFFNEVEILEGRLEYLYDTVDYFIIVESNTTYSGHSKPLNYLANIGRYKKYLDKIIYFPYAADVDGLVFDQSLTDPYNGKSAFWILENGQRNHILKAVKCFKDDDIVLVSDLDEIPSKQAIKIACDQFENGAETFALSQEMFYYNFSQKWSEPWNGTVISTNRFVKKQTPQWLRDMRYNIPSIVNGGYHLSYWGDKNRISTKITKFAHQELNKTEFTDPELIDRRIKLGKDPFDRQPLIPVPIENIQKEFYDVFSKYQIR
jgi:beta-1,4-mannosyl-glycoprotein beta-1,4-N-acetylglucosaminyltransferase